MRPGSELPAEQQVLAEFVTLEGDQGGDERVGEDARVSVWRRMRLDQCCEIVSGATPSTSVASYWDGHICWATPKDLGDLEGSLIVDTPRKITRAGLEACAASILPPGSVLFSSRAPIGHVAINTVPMATNQGFKSFVPDRRLMEARYLYHWLRFSRPYLERLGNGATFKEVSKAVVSRIEVPVPTVDEQRSIAAILDQADALRAKRRAALARLDEMARAIFTSLFGNLRSNYKQWPTVNIQEVCDLIVDCVNRTAPLSEIPTPYNMIRTTNVRYGKVDLTNVRYVTKSIFERWNRRATPRAGDVLLTREAPFGEAGLIEGDEHVFLGQRLMLYRVSPSIMLPEFLLWSFMDSFLLEQFNASGSGSTVKHIPLPACRSFELRLPPMKVQAVFAERLRTVDLLHKRTSQSLNQLSSLFASLQHRAFRGEL